ncbi:MAG: hypothetical protein LBG84_09900 [Treponema sp.]|jgi:hypothetical protein|nr:hypothetical protein [Treponema sp.]
MKRYNKRTAVLFVIALAVTAAVITAGCGSTPKAPRQKTEMLDWKGAALGAQIPEWVLKSSESDVHIQSLDEFKDQYCFVVYREDPVKDQVVTWVSNAANGASEVARMVSTTVNDTAEAQEGIKSGDAKVKQNVQQIRNAMSNANFRGLRRVGDFWTLSRNRATKNEYYTAFALWIIPEQDLNTQIAALWQNFIDNNSAMSAAERQIYGDIIKNLRSRLLSKVK